MGGGAIRTAARAAVLAGQRSTTALRPPTLPTAAAASTVHVAVDGETAPLISSVSSEKNAGAPGMVQWPAWELDDWEFAGGMEEEAVASEPPQRLVFGPAPTLQEAEEATADLKEAIEKVYFSSATAEDSIKANQVSIVGESGAVVPSVPKHVVQAFSLLHGSPEAQSVVASLACDKNVWDAVMKNDKVMEFYNKHQSVILPSETNVAPEESTEENVINLEGLFAETMESHDKETSEDSAFFTDIMHNIKVKASEIMSKITGFLQDFQDFVGGLSESQGTTNPRTTTSTWDKYGDLPIGASFLALAVAAILVILVKRG